MRRWRAQPERLPTGRSAGGRHIWLPLGSNLIRGTAILAGLPAVSGYSLQFLGFLYPDVVATLVVSALAALGWGVLRTGLAFVALRGSDARPRGSLAGGGSMNMDPSTADPVRAG